MIQLKLEINEVNQILDALGDQPFKEVFQLINKIQSQAATQLPSDGRGEEDNLPESKTTES